MRFYNTRLSKIIMEKKDIERAQMGWKKKSTEEISGLNCASKTK